MGEHDCLFKNILIPISSEYYSKKVLLRGVFLSKKFESTINLVYIIEEKKFHHADKLVDSYRTATEKEETKKQIINTQRQAADTIIFEDAKQMFNKKGIKIKEKIAKGEFSDIIKQELSKQKHDLILMGFEKECVLNYRLLSEVDIPVWIEGIGDSKKILAVLTNLAPNQKVPEVSMELSKKLGWDLHMLYVVDTEDSVQVDKKGKRSEIKTEEMLLAKGMELLGKLNGGKAKTHLVKGSLEKETIKTAEKIDANLVIVGREQKKKGVLGLPVKNLKKKLAEKCEYSILFLN